MDLKINIIFRLGWIQGNNLNRYSLFKRQGKGQDDPPKPSGEKKDVSTAILDKKKAPNRLIAEEAL
jgi:hypothetical protein